MVRRCLGLTEGFYKKVTIPLYGDGENYELGIFSRMVQKKDEALSILQKLVLRRYR